MRWLLFVVCCWMCVVGCLLSCVGCCMLFAIVYDACRLLLLFVLVDGRSVLLFVVCCSLLRVVWCCSLCVVCCLLCAVCCLLLDGCCWLSVKGLLCVDCVALFVVVVVSWWVFVVRRCLFSRVFLLCDVL